MESRYGYIVKYSDVSVEGYLNVSIDMKWEIADSPFVFSDNDTYDLIRDFVADNDEYKFQCFTTLSLERI